VNALEDLWKVSPDARIEDLDAAAAEEPENQFTPVALKYEDAAQYQVQATAAGVRHTVLLDRATAGCCCFCIILACCRLLCLACCSHVMPGLQNVVCARSCWLYWIEASDGNILFAASAAATWLPAVCV
jgi:hypothetical protein